MCVQLDHLPLSCLRIGLQIHTLNKTSRIEQSRLGFTLVVAHKAEWLDFIDHNI